MPYVLRCLAATLGADEFFRFAAGALLAVAVLRVASTGCGNWDPGTFGKHQTKKLKIPGMTAGAAGCRNWDSKTSGKHQTKN